MREIKMYKILIIEDEEAIAELEKDYLELSGFVVELEKDGEEGLKKALSSNYDLYILDVMLPGSDGYETLRILRKDMGIPVLMMSAKNDDQSKILGLDVGADDYIEKPFSFPFLSSKIKAILRRNYDMAQEHKELTYKDIKIDLDDMTVRKGDKVIPVNGKELDILVYFLKNPDKVIRKEVLFNAVWGTDCFSEISTLTVYIRWLREKIEDDPKSPKRIVTVWGKGYKFE
jgi:DNA-binding response OmpR family regulator